MKVEVSPMSLNAEVEVSVADELAMLIAVSCQRELSIGPVAPLIVADALANTTVAKLANGRTRESAEGASTIHSADERWACQLSWRVVKESFARLASAIVNRN